MKWQMELAPTSVPAIGCWLWALVGTVFGGPIEMIIAALFWAVVMSLLTLFLWIGLK